MVRGIATLFIDSKYSNRIVPCGLWFHDPVHVVLLEFPCWSVSSRLCSGCDSRSFVFISVVACLCGKSLFFSAAEHRSKGGVSDTNGRHESVDVGFFFNSILFL